MKFIQYPKIQPINDLALQRYRTDFQTLQNDWYVTEMIDGLHLALYADMATGFFRAACRKRFLHEHDNYGVWKDIVKTHKAWVQSLSHKLNCPIIIYGKMTGGIYKGESKGTIIKSVCEYSTDNEYFIHDIMLPSGFLSREELKESTDSVAVSPVPVIFKGTFAKANTYPENKLSLVPFLNYLDASYANEMKGIVIRPNCDLYNDKERMILKKINRTYVGSNRHIRARKTEITPTITNIAVYMENQATQKSMMDIAINHMGAFEEYDIPKLVGRYVSYLLDHVTYIKYNMLTKPQKHMVRKELNRLATKKLNNLLLGNVA